MAMLNYQRVTLLETFQLVVVDSHAWYYKPPWLAHSLCTIYIKVICHMYIGTTRHFHEF